MKKLFASLFVAGLLLSGVVGCGGGATTAPTTPVKKVDPMGDPKDAKAKAIADAKDAVAAAEKDLKALKDDAKKEEKEKAQKAVDDAKAALKKLEDAK